MNAATATGAASPAASTRFEPAACAQCGGRDAETLYRFDFDGEEAGIARCRACGLAFTTPRPRAEALGGFYGSGYYSFRAPALPDTTAPLSGKERLRRAILVRHYGYPASIGGASALPPPVTGWLGHFMALPYFVPGGRLLDVGCGSGERMLEFASFGWDVAGLEFSPEAAEAGRSVGLDIRNEDVTATSFAPASFDCVSFYHSLEHVYDPAAALAAAFRLLKPGGELLVAVPNFGSSERRLFGARWGWLQMPTHLFHFTRASLARFVREAGYADIAISPSFHGYSVDGSMFGALRRPAEAGLSAAALLLATLGDGKALTLRARRPAR